MTFMGYKRLFLCQFKRRTKMTDKQRAQCHSIIHIASVAAAGVGVGLAQLPCSDSIAIIPIQITMVISLGSVFGIRLNNSTAEATLATATATMVGRGISQILIGWIPVIGNVVNAATAAGISETLGWAIAADFANRPAKSIRGGK
jgi:uncharacterized protein (DUF697 family)